MNLAQRENKLTNDLIREARREAGLHVGKRGRIPKMAPTGKGPGKRMIPPRKKPTKVTKKRVKEILALLQDAQSPNFDPPYPSW